MENKYQHLQALSQEITKQVQNKNQFEKLKKVFLNTLDLQILKPSRALNDIEKQVFYENKIDPVMVNFSKPSWDKATLESEVNNLKSTYQSDVKPYKDLYEYVKTIGQNNSYSQLDMYKLMNVYHYLENNGSDFDALKKQNKDLDKYYTNDNLSLLDKYHLNNMYDFNAENLYYFNVGLNQYLSSLSLEEFKKLVKKQNYDANEYQTTYNQKIPNFNDKQLETLHRQIKIQSQINSNFWNNIDEKNKTELLKSIKFVVNQNENNIQKQGAFVLNNYLSDPKISEFLNDPFKDEYYYKNQMKLKKTYDMYLTNLSGVLNNSRISKDFLTISNEIKNQSIEKEELRNTREFNTYYYDNINNIATNYQNQKDANDEKIEDIEQNIFNSENEVNLENSSNFDVFKNQLSFIPDYQLLMFVRSYYPILDNELSDENFLDKDGNLKKKIQYKGKELSDKEFRNQMQNAFINEFLLKEDKDGEDNIYELFKDRYSTMKQGLHHFDHKLVMKSNGKVFTFDLDAPFDKIEMNNAQYQEYCLNLNKERNTARLFFDKLINQQVNNQKQYKDKIDALNTKNEKNINGLKKDSKIGKLLNLTRKRYVLLGLMLVNLPMAFGLLGLSFIVHFISVKIKKMQNKKYIKDYEDAKKQLEQSKDYLFNNRLKSFDELNDKINKIDDNKYQRDVKEYQQQKGMFINKLKDAKMFYLPSFKRNQLDKSDKDGDFKILKEYNSLYATKYDEILDNKNLIFGIDINEFKGQNLQEKHKAFMRFNDIMANNTASNQSLKSLGILDCFIPNAANDYFVNVDLDSPDTQSQLDILHNNITNIWDRNNINNNEIYTLYQNISTGKKKRRFNFEEDENEQENLNTQKKGKSYGFTR